jgi:hypothetical protein
MAKNVRDYQAVGKQSSKGEHGGNRGGGKEKVPERSNPKAGQDPHRGGRPTAAPPRSPGASK